VKRLTPHGDQQFDPRFLVCLNNPRAEITGVRELRFGFAQIVHRRRSQKSGLPINRSEIAHRRASIGVQAST
jgi:hypothetical protein